MAKRVAEMDMARGLATLAVVAIHVSADPLIQNARGGGITWLYLLANVAARFAVPVFVTLSGMGLAFSRRPEGYFSFEKRRLSKLLPAYICWSVLYSLTRGYLDGPATLMQSLRVPVWHVLTDILTGEGSYHLYFVPLIVILYLLFPLLRRVLSTWPGFIASAVVTAVAISVGHYVDVPSWAEQLIDIRSPLNWFFYFAMGIKLAQAANLDVLRTRRWKLAASSGLLICLAIMLVIVRRLCVATNDIDASLDALGPIIMVYTALFIAWVWSREWGDGPASAALRWTSKWSYMIYLSHVFALMCFVRIYSAIDKSTGTALYGIGGLVTVVVASGLFAAISTFTRTLISKRSAPAH
jgi:probable poly-beta-1,6-N-acetyl-D-glucosamine export protein